MRWTRTTKIDVLLSAAAVLAVSGPLLFTRSGFAFDFTNSLWLVWVAGKDLVQAGHPGFFLNTTKFGVFYPLFAFYGGPLFAATGAIAELLGGNAVLAFLGVTVLAIAGVYGGTLWLARQLGVRGLTAHAPALTILTSAYFITNLYGRGAWTEFMVAAAMPPLLASGLHLVRAEAWRPLPIAIFAISAALFTSGHNITLLWGTTIALAVLLILWLVLGAPRDLPYRRLAMVAGLGLAAGLINAWFLLPDIAYAGKTAVAHSEAEASAIWSETKEFNSPSVLLDPLRRVPRESTTPALYVQAPDWLIAWGLLAAALLLWRRALPGALRRFWLAAIAILVLLLGMIMIKPFWQIVSYPFSEIQFPYRLGTYVFYAAAALVLVAALALQRIAASGESPRVVTGLRIALAASCAVSLGLCFWQQWVPNTIYPHSYVNRTEALVSPNIVPRTWYSGGDYEEGIASVIATPSNYVLSIPPSAVHGDRFAATLNVPPGPAPILTNISGGPDLVHIKGLKFIGRSPNDFAVLQRENGSSGPVHVVVETTPSAIVELGRAISLLALLVVLAVLIYAAVRARVRLARSAAHARDPQRPMARAGESA